MKLYFAWHSGTATSHVISPEDRGGSMDINDLDIGDPGADSGHSDVAVDVGHGDGAGPSCVDYDDALHSDHPLSDDLHPDVFHHDDDLGAADTVSWNMPTLDTATVGPGIIGDPVDDMAYWHLQDGNTCAVDAQQFVIEQLTGQSVTEQQLVQEAEAHGWFTPEGGTPADDVGKLLELHGLTVEHHWGATIDDIATQLSAGHGVIVGVNAETIWGIPTQGGQSQTLASCPTIPGQHADHAVEVSFPSRTRNEG